MVHGRVVDHTAGTFADDLAAGKWGLVASKGQDGSGDLSSANNLSELADKTQARANIYAAPFDALAYSGMQINGSMDVSQENGTTPAIANGYVIDCWKFIFLERWQCRLHNRPTRLGL